MKCELMLFTGTMPSQVCARSSKCLSPPKADEFPFRSKARGCMVVKSL